MKKLDLTSVSARHAKTKCSSAEVSPTPKDLNFLRGKKEKNENEDLTENIEDKYPDTKKPFPKYTSAKRSSLRKDHEFLASTDKEAGALLDRIQQTKAPAQKLSGILQGAIDKFRSLVFEVSGSDKIIEVAKVGDGLEMKVFEDKDTPTPSSEKKLTFNSFLTLFMDKIVPSSGEEVAQELAEKGVAEVKRPFFASLKKALLRKASSEDVIHLEEDSINGEDATQVLDMIKAGDMEGALEYLKRWHYPGEHQTRESQGIGSSDDTFEKDGYTLYWNTGLGYVGLVYEDEFEE